MKSYNPHQEQITLGKKQLVRLKRMQQALEDLRSSVTDWGTYDE